MRVSLKAILILCLLGGIGTAQDRDQVLPPVREESAWVLYQKGSMYVDQGKFGEAVSLLESALLKRQAELKAKNYDPDQIGFPEADMALGKIYTQMEPELASFHYQRAYEHKDLLYIPENAYAILYSLVDLYTYYPWLGQKQNSDYYQIYYWLSPDKNAEYYLEAVLKEKPDYYTNQFQLLRGRYLDTYLESGPDKLLELYRLDAGSLARAHAELGLYYLKQGRPLSYSRAVDHYLSFTVITLTELIRIIEQLEIGYKYNGVADLLMRARSYSQLETLLKKTEFFKHLYNLGLSTYGMASHVEEVLNQLIDKMRQLTPSFTYTEGKDILFQAGKYTVLLKSIDEMYAGDPSLFSFTSRKELETEMLLEPKLTGLLNALRELDPLTEITRGTQILGRKSEYQFIKDNLAELKIYTDLNNLGLDSFGITTYQWTTDQFLESINRITTEKAQQVWNLILDVYSDAPFIQLVRSQYYNPQIKPPLD